MANIPELDDYKQNVEKEEHKKVRTSQLKNKGIFDLGLCPINQTTQKNAEIFNPNSYPVEFNFEYETFIITPARGSIPPKSKITINFSFVPQEAIAITEKIILNLTEEEPRHIEIKAVGKYPYISVENRNIIFDKLLVGKMEAKSLYIKNSSSVSARFQIVQVKDDDFKDNSFALNQYNGEIPPNQEIAIDILYAPQIANSTSVAHYRITCPGGNDIIFECMGSSQGYDVSLNTNSINFGEIKIHDQNSRLLTIHNNSDVPVVFEFFNDQKNVFGFSRTKGRIKPKSHERIIIYFVPKHTICYYERVFCLVRNHSILYVDLIGTCYDLLIKPLPLLQKHIDIFRRRVIQGKISEIDFRYMENAALMKVSQTFQQNQNQTLNQFSNYSPTKKSFKNNNNTGLEISQGLNQTVNSKFDEQEGEEENYNQLVSLVKNNQKGQQSTYRGVDSSLVEPANFQNQIVLHKEMFQLPNNPNKLMTLSEEFLDFNFCEFNGETQTKELVLTNKMACKMTVFWTIQKHEGINNQQSVVFNVSPETATIKPNQSFNFQVTFKPSKSQYYFFQSLQFFTFKYSAKLTKKIIEDAQKAQQKTLNQSIINALKGTVNQSNTLKQKTEQFTADETIPPYSGSILCVGHSFGAGSQPYIPILEVYPNKNIYFAACSREETQYQTVEIHNTSDTPTYFKFSPDPQQIFSVYPIAGLIQGKSFQVVVFQFSPKDFKAYNTQLSCSLNHNLSNSLNFNLHGYCSEPALSLQNNGKVFFPPSYTGVYSTQKVKVRNLSRIELQFNIDIPQKYQDELYLEPSNGAIKPNETLFLNCSFVPYKKKDYRIKVPINAIEVLDPNQSLIGYHIPGSGSLTKPLAQRKAKEVNYQFEIFGAGGDGSLSLEPQEINFPIVKVNFSEKKYVTLHNYSNCTFYIELKLKKIKKDLNPNSTDDDEDQTEDLTESQFQQYIGKHFSLDFQNGIIAANSKIDIGITFNPAQVGQHDIQLEVIAKEKNPMANNPETSKKLICQKCTMRIKAIGSYPMLKICDVRNVEISVASLWENFQINKINNELSSQLNEDEKQFLNIEQLNFTEAASLQKRLKSYDWNFGYLPSKAHVKPRKIVITIQNVGGTVCDWQFKLPSDNQIQVEPWADAGEPTPEDAFEKAIIERKIFQIYPKTGSLKPSEFQDIVLVYSPGNSDDTLLFNKKQQQKKSEQHFLRVILQIINGKPLCLNLRGMTLAPLEGRLAVKKNHYVLPDTPIGLLVPVKVPIEIQNVGSSKVNYKVEITERDQQGNIIKSKFDIFSVENSSGSLQPGEKQYLYTCFKPLETKTYYHELKIKVNDFVRLIQECKITVEGKGYGKVPPKKIKQKKALVPSQRSHVSTIGSKVFFSIEEIDFGKLQPGKAAHRIILLYNLSENQKLKFDFQGANISLSSDNKLTCGDLFQIEPVQGQLNPGAWCELKLTLTAKETPSVYEGEIECGIEWETNNPEEKTNQFTQVSQNSGNTLSPERETLFLRIKKHSSLDVELVNSFKEQKFKENMDKHFFEQILENVIHDVLNESKTDKILQKIDEQPAQLFSYFDAEEPVSIEKVSPGLVSEKSSNIRNFKDYRQLFLEDEFVDLVDLIMENTYFNIIQETTRGECDLLKISKTFVMPSNNR